MIATETVSSGKLGRNSGRFGAGVTAVLSDRMDVRVNYDFEVFDHTSTNEFGVVMGLYW